MLAQSKEPAILLADRVQRIKPSPTLAVSARADELIAQGKDIISLSIGEPDFDTPQHIKDAAIKAIDDGCTKYTSVDGTKSLKQAVIEKFARENNLRYALNQIIVSCGAKHSIYNLFSAVLNAGDEVIIPAPYWVSYPDMVMLCDGTPVFIPTDLKQNFKITPQQLEEAITQKTRLLIINSPSNPSGKAYSEIELKALAEVLLRHPHVLIASDDIYEHHMWNNLPFKNILNVCPELFDRTFVINSVSKTYAMTGWRIGYTGGPVEVIAAMKKAQSQSTSSPPTVSQYAALAALTGDQTCVSEMTLAYKERHDFVFAELSSIPGIECLASDGTFYTLPYVKNLYDKGRGINNDVEFSEYLLSEAGLAVIPGTPFGAPDHIRICYTTSMHSLKEAMRRMKEAIYKLNR